MCVSVCVFGLFTLELLQIVPSQSCLTGLLGKVLFFKSLANGLLKTCADENEITSTGETFLAPSAATGALGGL